MADGAAFPQRGARAARGLGQQPPLIFHREIDPKPFIKPVHPSVCAHNNPKTHHRPSRTPSHRHTLAFQSRNQQTNLGPATSHKKHLAPPFIPHSSQPNHLRSTPTHGGWCDRLGPGRPLGAVRQGPRDPVCCVSRICRGLHRPRLRVRLPCVCPHVSHRQGGHNRGTLIIVNNRKRGHERVCIKNRRRGRRVGVGARAQRCQRSTRACCTRRALFPASALLLSGRPPGPCSSPPPLT